MKDIQEQIRCVSREIGMRESVYPKWVESKRMSAAKAQLEIEGMEAVLATLKDVQLYQTLVKSLSLPAAEVNAIFTRLAGDFNNNAKPEKENANGN